MANPLGKSRKVDNPYATFFVENKETGAWIEWRVLKTYQLPHKEQENPYGRWFVAASSPYTNGSYDMGDTYINDIIRTNPKLIQASPEWKEAYGQD